MCIRDRAGAMAVAMVVVMAVAVAVAMAAATRPASQPAILGFKTYGFVRSCPKKVEKTSCEIAVFKKVVNPSIDSE